MKKHQQDHPHEAFIDSGSLIFMRPDGTTVEVPATSFPDRMPLQVGGKVLDLPYRCPQCHQAGLALTFMEGQGRVDIVCALREDARGHTYGGCDRTITSFPATRAIWNALLADSITRTLFLIGGEVMGDIADLFGDDPVLPRLGEEDDA